MSDSAKNVFFSFLEYENSKILKLLNQVAEPLVQIKLILSEHPSY